MTDRVKVLNPFHNTEIVADADHQDWGRNWGVAVEDDKGCWCYSCWLEKTAASMEVSIEEVDMEGERQSAVHRAVS